MAKDEIEVVFEKIDFDIQIEGDSLKYRQFPINWFLGHIDEIDIDGDGQINYEDSIRMSSK